MKNDTRAELWAAALSETAHRVKAIENALTPGQWTARLNSRPRPSGAFKRTDGARRASWRVQSRGDSDELQSKCCRSGWRAT